MTFLPIADRELRVAARRRNTFWTRVASAGVGVLIGAWALLMSYVPIFGSQPGQLIFGLVSALSMVFCLLGGLLKTADCLSEEKRDGTLGLLFLTDLRGYDVVVGKLVATSLLWFYGLLAVFPILAMSLLLGGVAPGEFWRTILAQTNLLFISLALGLFISAISRNERRAMAGVGVTLFLLFQVPGWLGEWHKAATSAREVAPGFLMVSPGRALTLASDGYYLRQRGQFWGALLCSHLIGWLCIALASVLVVRSWQDQAATVRASRWHRWRDRWQLGSPTARVAARRRWLPINPFLWLATRDRWKTLVVYGALAIFVGYFGLEGIFSNRNQPGFSAGYIMLGAMGASLFKVWVAMEACRRFVEDRRSGALELILCTPLSIDEILRGQRRALSRQFAGPALIILSLGAFLLSYHLLQSWPKTSEDFWNAIVPYVVWAIVFVADLFALAQLGMWLGLTSRHIFAATGKAVFLIQVMPWILFYAAMSMLLVLVIPRLVMGTPVIRVPFFSQPWFFMILWCALSLAFAGFFYFWAARKLSREFRERVMAIPKRRARKRKKGSVPPLLPTP